MSNSICKNMQSHKNYFFILILECFDTLILNIFSLRDIAFIHSNKLKNETE